MTDYNVISSKEIQYNWNHFNQLQNTFNLHVIDYDMKYPKNLIIQCHKEFLELCKQKHIDATCFKYVEVTKWDCTYQVDFFDNDQLTDNGFSISNIYYDSKNKKILQSEFVMI